MAEEESSIDFKVQALLYWPYLWVAVHDKGTYEGDAVIGVAVTKEAAQKLCEQHQKSQWRREDPTILWDQDEDEFIGDHVSHGEGYINRYRVSRISVYDPEAGDPES